MNKIFANTMTVLVAGIILTFILAGQTAPRVGQLFSGTAVSRVLIQVAGSPWVQTATIGQGLQLRANVGNYELATTGNLTEQIAVCKNANGECVVPVAPAAGTLVKVFRNGLLLELTEDYTWDAATRKVALSALQGRAPDDKLSVYYWIAP